MPSDASDLRYSLDTLMDRKIGGIAGPIPARVERYDPKTQEVEVRPQIKLLRRDEEGTEIQESQPVIVAVPVVFLGGAKGDVMCPIEVNDTVLLIFCKQSLEDWLQNGGEVDGSRAKHFGMSEAIAIPGLCDFGHPKPELMDHASPPAPVRDGIGVRARDGLQVLVRKSVIELGGIDEGVGLGDAIKSYIDSKVVQAFNVHTHSSGAPGSPTTPPVVPMEAPPALASAKVKVAR